MYLQRLYQGASIVLIAFSLVVVTPVPAATVRSNGAPTITAVTPQQGVAGTKVTITGTNLAGAQVQFNGATAELILANTATQIMVRVPAEVTTGPVTVSTPEGMAQSAVSFTILPSAPSSVPKPKHPKPLILGFTPMHGTVGTQVTLNGKNFGGATWVKVGGARATFTVPSSTRIVATVPRGAHSGKISVHTSAGLGISGRLFTFSPA